ncbi:MAG: hypothetical protein AAFO82_11990 [Bacteroidota bacterium]
MKTSVKTRLRDEKRCIRDIETSGQILDMYPIYSKMLISGMIGSISSILVFAWRWSIVIGLQFKIPQDVKINVRRFKVFFAILIIISSFLFYVALGYFLDHTLNSSITPLALPISLIILYCVINILLFSAKTLKTAELQRKAKLGDYIGDFFSIWIYPVDVWLLQPRINRLLEEDH